MAYLTTIAELKSYTLRKLGSEVHDVEITDSQWDDILNDSYKDFTEYSSDACVELVSRATLTSNTVILSDNVLNIKKIFDGTSTSAINDMFGSGEYYLPISLSDIYKNGTESIVDNIISTRQILTNLRNITMMEIDFDYNPETHKLVIHADDFSGEIVFIGDVAEDVEDILNNKYFKMMVEARCLRQWSRNISLKYNTEEASITGNGLKLNPARMLEEAKELEERIEKGIDENEWSLIAPRKLYQF